MKALKARVQPVADDGSSGLPPCPNCGGEVRWLPSDDEEYAVLLEHKVATCPYGRTIYHETRELAADMWMRHLREKWSHRFPAPKIRPVAKPGSVPFESLRALDGEARRAWMRGWMERMGLENANRAAPVLGLTRQSVERMLYEGSRSRTAVTDQTLRVAQLVERLGLKRAS